MAFKSLIKKRRKGGFPILVIVMLIFLVIAFFVGGKELLWKTFLRELMGVAFTLVLMVILRRVKKARAKRR
jgi:hypothetical protein